MPQLLRMFRTVAVLSAVPTGKKLPGQSVANIYWQSACKVHAEMLENVAGADGGHKAASLLVDTLLYTM